MEVHNPHIKKIGLTFIWNDIAQTSQKESKEFQLLQESNITPMPSNQANVSYFLRGKF
jgi:hypothetical protein